MYWADYRDAARKARVHIGFDLNRGIPKKFTALEWLAAMCSHIPNRGVQMETTWSLLF
jgi:hypothetical protein